MSAKLMSEPSIISSRRWMRTGVPRALALIAAIGFARTASALEPLETFLAASEARSFDAREANTLVEQRTVEKDQAWLRLTPIATVTGAYTRNQYDVQVMIPTGEAGAPSKTATITPQNQGDFIASLSVPLIDVGSWEKIGVAGRTLDAARSHAKATRIDVARTVARDYYQLVAALALVEAADISLDTAKKNLAFVTQRREAGVGSELDARRAVAEVERNRQALSDAHYQEAIARRQLKTASGQTPTGNAAPLDVDLLPPPPLASLEALNVESLPSVRSQFDDATAQDRQTFATRALLYPSLAATAQEHVTNAVGFGKSAFYALGVTATWKIDPSTFAAVSAQSKAAATAHVREERAKQQAKDDIFTAWQEVARDIEKATSARAELDASQFAAKIARDKYDAGTATFLDLTTAERDSFTAKVARIQADADLAYARVALRLAVGRPAVEAQ